MKYLLLRTQMRLREISDSCGGTTSAALKTEEFCNGRLFTLGV